MVKRYDPSEVLTDRWEMGSMDEAANGDYVHWDDYEQLLKELIDTRRNFVRDTDELIAERDALKEALMPFTSLNSSDESITVVLKTSHITKARKLL